MLQAINHLELLLLNLASISLFKEKKEQPPSLSDQVNNVKEVQPWGKLFREPLRFSFSLLFSSSQPHSSSSSFLLLPPGKQSCVICELEHPLDTQLIQTIVCASCSKSLLKYVHTRKQQYVNYMSISFWTCVGISQAHWLDEKVLVGWSCR